MSHDLYNNLLESGLSQHVNKPTKGDNILDLIFSTNDGLVNNVNTGSEFSTSVYRIISFNINLELYKDNVNEEPIFMYRKGNFEKLRKILADTDWSIVENEIDVNKSWENFYNILNGAVKLCIPICKRRLRKNINEPKWWNRQIETGLLPKKCALVRYLLSQNENDKIEYERLRRKTKQNMIRGSKNDLKINIANKTKFNPKEFYTNVRNKKLS